MKYVPWVGWLLALVFMFLFYRSCQPPAVVVTTSKGDSIMAKANQIHTSDSVKIDSFKLVSYYWQERYDSLFTSFSKKEKQVVASAQAVQKLSDSIKYYKSVNDTLKELTTIGDLLDEDSVLLETLSQARIEIDSLHSSHEKALEAADSTATYYKDEVNSLLLSIVQLKLEYDSAVAEENKLIKIGKTNAVWAKVATVTTAILTSILILKK